jgi:hypothetical protein
MTIEAIVEKHKNGEYKDKFTAFGAVADVVIVYTDGTTTKTSGPCHACVNRVLNRNKPGVVITRSVPELAENPGAVLYFDWLVNRSFFSDVFLCKDAATNLKYGFIKRVDVEAAKWLGAAQLGRLPTSEYRENMLAVYDILASGFEIHPMLLTALATRLDFKTDSKRIYSSSSRVRQSVDGFLYNTGTTHLPFSKLNTSETLKEVCKDDPNKVTKFSASHLFNQGSWPSGCHQVLGGNDTSKNDLDINKLLSDMTAGAASLLFNAKEAVTGDYTYLWLNAVQLLHNKLGVNKDQKGFPTNLSVIEAYSKSLKLGA